MVFNVATWYFNAATWYFNAATWYFNAGTHYFIRQVIMLEHSILAQQMTSVTRECDSTATRCLKELRVKQMLRPTTLFET